MTNNRSLEEFIKQINRTEQDALPPVDRWHPPLSGDMDMRIAADGTWYHEGEPIVRRELVKLFAGILRREADGEYYLVSPQEKFRIQVDDAPFVATEFEEQRRAGQRILVFTTNLGDRVAADSGHPIWVDERAGQPRPYVLVRNNLKALISRNLFYQLVELAEEREEQGKIVLAVCSGGVYFRLGAC